MVGCGARNSQRCDQPLRLHRRIHQHGHELLTLRHGSAAAARGQQPTRSHQAQRQRVQLLVPEHTCACACKLASTLKTVLGFESTVLTHTSLHTKLQSMLNMRSPMLQTRHAHCTHTHLDRALSREARLGASLGGSKITTSYCRPSSTAARMNLLTSAFTNSQRLCGRVQERALHLNFELTSSSHYTAQLTGLTKVRRLTASSAYLRHVVLRSITLCQGDGGC